MARLDDMVIDAPGPVVLVAQGLGCILVAAWAALSRHSERVKASLLVAPLNVEGPDMKNTLPGWSPILKKPMPFPAMVVGCDGETDFRGQWAQALAADWGARWVALDADEDLHAGVPDWPQGRLLMQRLLKE